MAIGTTAAILGSAAIGVGGSMLAAGGQRRAARDASNAEIAMARENNALAREFRAENTANFQPWLQSGGRANALVDSFLYGAPAAATPQTGTPQTNPVAGQQPVPGAQPQRGGFGSGVGFFHGLRSPAQRAAMMGGEPMTLPTGGPNGIGSGNFFGGNRGVTLPPGTAQPGGTVNTPAPQQGNAMSGYEAFVNSPYYQHPLQEGMRQLNTGYAARGMLESGDAMRAITRFGQDYGAGRMGEFIGLAERQSDRGLQGASAIAGVGQNALASMSANNAAIGNSQANRAIAGGVANANMWSGIGGAVGGAAGYLMGPGGFGRSSYGGLGALYAGGGIGT